MSARGSRALCSKLIKCIITAKDHRGDNKVYSIELTGNYETGHSTPSDMAIIFRFSGFAWTNLRVSKASKVTKNVRGISSIAMVLCEANNRVLPSIIAERRPTLSFLSLSQS